MSLLDVFKEKAGFARDNFAPAIKDLTAEAGNLAKEQAERAKGISKSGGIMALMKKPDEDDIVALSKKARKKANKLEKKAAKLEKKLKKIEKKQIKHLKKLEKESKGE